MVLPRNDRKKTMARGTRLAKEFRDKEFDGEMEVVLLKDKKFLDRLARVWKTGTRRGFEPAALRPLANHRTKFLDPYVPWEVSDQSQGRSLRRCLIQGVEHILDFVRLSENSKDRGYSNSSRGHLGRLPGWAQRPN